MFLVIPTMTYSETALVMVGSKIIDRAISMITKGELAKVTTIWRQAHFGVVMSGSLQLPDTSSNTTEVEKEVTHSSPGGDPMEPKEFLPIQCQKPSPHNTEGHHPPIQQTKCACQYQWQRTLYADPCAHRTDARAPVAYTSSTDGDLQRTSSWVLKGTHLFTQLRHPFCRNPHRDCGWAGCPCQPSATGGPPNKDFQGIQ